MTHLVFLSGASGSTEFWLPLIQHLPQNWSKQIIAYPGFGSEPAHPLVNNFAQLTHYMLQHITQPSILIAQSMGGIFAVAAALQQSQKVPSCRPAFVQDTTQKSVNDSEQNATQALVKGLVLIATSGGIDLSRFQVTDWRTAYREEFLHYPDCFTQVNRRFDAQLHQIELATLLCWGDADAISPIAVGQYLSQRLPKAQLKIIQGADHQLAYHHVHEVAQYMAHYVQEFASSSLAEKVSTT